MLGIKIGRRIVEFEQRGAKRAQYGSELLKRLSTELTARFGRGFSRHNLAWFRDFYLAFPPEKIRATLSLKSPEEAEGEKRATTSLDLANVPPSGVASWLSTFPESALRLLDEREGTFEARFCSAAIRWHCFAMIRRHHRGTAVVA